MKQINIKHLLASLAVLVSVSVSAETYTGTCGTNVNWELDTTSGVLTITGTGTMTNFSSFKGRGNPWNSYKGSIKTIIINSGVTSIGDESFFGFTSLTSLAKGPAVIMYLS